MTSSNSQSNHRHLRRKFDQGVVRWIIASIYSMKKVLPTIDNIRTELKQSIGDTGSKGRIRKYLLHTKSAYTRCWQNQEVQMERQDVVLSRIRCLRMVRELREAGYTDEIYVHTSYAVPKIVSEYDQEIPQSQTADNPVAPRGRAAQPSRDTRKTN